MIYLKYWLTWSTSEPPSPHRSVKNLGVWFDSDFSFSKDVQNVCKGLFSQLRDFRNIRQFLTTVTHFLGVSLKSIFIDYSLSIKVLLELLQIRVNTLG